MSDQNKELEKIVGDYKYGFKTDVETVFDTGRGIIYQVFILMNIFIILNPVKKLRVAGMMFQRQLRKLLIN